MFVNGMKLGFGLLAAAVICVIPLAVLAVASERGFRARGIRGSADLFEELGKPC